MVLVVAITSIVHRIKQQEERVWESEFRLSDSPSYTVGSHLSIFSTSGLRTVSYSCSCIMLYVWTCMK